MLVPKIEAKKNSRFVMNIDNDIKEVFRKICEEKNLTMTDVIDYTIREIVKKGDINSIEYRVLDKAVL